MKKHIASIIILLSVLSIEHTQAQTSRDSETFTVKSEKTASKKKKKKLFTEKYNKKMNDAVKEFDQLMKSNVKKRARRERKMKKPQYSNPAYFGHKRPPKKRPASKRKMCKECGIIH